MGKLWFPSLTAKVERAEWRLCQLQISPLSKKGRGTQKWE
jgi:hypothetical protein